MSTEKNELSDEDREILRIQILRKRSAQCPRCDKVQLDIRNATEFGAETPSFRIRFPVCGLDEMLKGPK